MSEENRFRLDVDRLLDEVRRSGSDYAVIVNPNNPVGNLLQLDDVRRILESGVMLVIDEAFMAFTDPRHSAEQLISQYKSDHRDELDQVGRRRRT